MIEALDLFAGAGGWSVACRDLGICEVGVELDEWACKTRNAAGFATICMDVERCPVLLHDLLIASPPCQGFSAAGKRNPRDRRNTLVFSMWRYIVEAHPRFVAFEQVPLVLPVWKMYARALRDRGYSAWCGILHAEQYSVPQTRKRAILIARRDGRVASPPTPTHSRYYPRDPQRLDSDVAPWVSMAEALAWGPSQAVTHASYYWERPAPTLVTSRRSDEGIVVGRQLPEGEERHPAHGGWTLKRPTPTGKPRQAGGVRITLQEAAVLQSFPPDFPFQGVKMRQFQQVGNAIPAALARAILATFL